MRSLISWCAESDHHHLFSLLQNYHTCHSPFLVAGPREEEKNLPEVPNKASRSQLWWVGNLNICRLPLSSFSGDLSFLPSPPSKASQWTEKWVRKSWMRWARISWSVPPPSVVVVRGAAWRHKWGADVEMQYCIFIENFFLYYGTSKIDIE